MAQVFRALVFAVILALCAWGMWALLRFAGLATTAEARWKSHSEQAALAVREKRYVDAEKLYAAALAESRAWPAADPRHLWGLSGLAALYRAQVKYAQAEPLYRQALEAIEKAHGPEHPSVAGPLAGLGEMYYEWSKYGQSEPLLRRALAIREKALGPDHADVAASLGGLVNLYEAQGEYALAEPLARRIVAIREKAQDQAGLAAAIESCAALLDRLKRTEEARAMRQRRGGKK